jgi:hypothetical protein
MSRRRPQTRHRLVPLEILYPNHPPRPDTAKRLLTPFRKPGPGAKIPDKLEEQPCVRFLQASSILRDLKMLKQPLRDIEADSAFIANAMNSGLQVPRAIDRTFDRIHGRIYDIQREIEYAANGLEGSALVIQRNFRAFRARRHYHFITNALHGMIRRDCSAIHECFLGFLLAYAKGDDHFRLHLNRRFLVRGRNALKYWRQWAVGERALSQRRKGRVAEMQLEWLRRRAGALLRVWRDLSFSRHSRKALRALEGRIAAEAQLRLAQRLDADPNVSILEQLALEREAVIVDFAQENYHRHILSIMFRFWRVDVDQSKRHSRSGNALANEFWVRRKKQSFFEAWRALSLGRVVVFGGYSEWRCPVNRRRDVYKDRFAREHAVIVAWRWLVHRPKQIVSFQIRANANFLRRCLRAFRETCTSRHQRLASMIETYLTILRNRERLIFEAWYKYVRVQRIRKRPMLFISRRAALMRVYRTVRRTFVRWTVRFAQLQAQRQRRELIDMDTYMAGWAEAGRQMQDSMQNIVQLNQKLGGELEQRKADLAESDATVIFMRAEEKSLIYAMLNAKREIERLHQVIGKSAMRYFVDTKPIQGSVVVDVPGALATYMQQKEQDQAKAAAQKAAQAAQAVQQQTQQKAVAQGRRRRSVAPKASEKLKSVKSVGKMGRISGVPRTMDTIDE